MHIEREVTGKVLIFAHPEDPLTSRFKHFAAGYGLSTWQPATLEEIGWSFSLEHSRRSLDIHDLRRGHRWPVAKMAGIWFQSMPPLAAYAKLDEVDRRYVTAEFKSSTRLLWHEAECPVVGQPRSTCPWGLFDFGLESRVQIRQLGLPALADQIGSLSSLRASLGNTSATHVRITRTVGASSFWLTNAHVPDQSAAEPDIGSELVAATITDRRPTRIAVHAGMDTLVIEVDENGHPSPVIEDDETRAIRTISQRVQKVTGTRVGVTYFGHGGEGWAIARVSLQIPYWLNEIVTPWLFPRLVTIFTAPESNQWRA